MKNIRFIVLSVLTLTLISCSSLFIKEDNSSIDVVATYRERIALLPGAKIIAILEDVSKADTSSIEIGKTELSAGMPPYKLTVNFSKRDIIKKHRYNVRVKIIKDEKLLFISTEAYNPFKESNKIIVLQKVTF